MKLTALIASFGLKTDDTFDENLVIKGVNTLKEAREGDLSFFTNKKYREDLLTTRASAVLLEEPIDGCPAIQCVVKNPYAVLARILQKMYPESRPEPGVHPSAVIASSAKIGENCYIGPYCIVEDHAQIGSGSVLFGHVFVGSGSTLGQNCTLYSHVTLYHGVHLGDRVRVHANTVVGSDGFGFAQDQGRHVKIPQLGGVRIGDDVEIGSNTSIDRGAQSDTRIGDGCIIDNLVQVAHGVELGNHCILAGQAGISGSTKIGDHSVMAGRAGTVGHIEIGTQTVLMAQSVATKSIDKPGYYAGFPAKPVEEYHRETAGLRRIESMRKKIRELEKWLKHISISKK